MAFKPLRIFDEVVTLNYEKIPGNYLFYQSLSKGAMEVDKESLARTLGLDADTCLYEEIFI